MTEMKYRAFISYSHHDAKWAKRIQKNLESYRIPRSSGITRRYPLRPVFRDRSELTAGKLAPIISEALHSSEALVVVCSPAAAASEWVEKEVSEFMAIRPGAPILPFVIETDGSDVGSSFPPSLRLDGSSQDQTLDEQIELLAPDARHGQDGARDALLKLKAALLGVGFDQLKRRAYRRRIIQLTGGVASLFVVVIVTSLLAYTASTARAEAERRRMQAENLISFMLGDLRSQLEELGRLDVLDAVADKSVDFFSNLESSDESDEVLLSRAKALRQLGDIRLQQGRSSDAINSFEQALVQNNELVNRSPNDTTRLFELAQAEFWVGYSLFRRAQVGNAIPHFENYLKHSKNLVALDEKPEYLLEVAYANSNLGTASRDLNEFSQASGYFDEAELILRGLLDSDPANPTLIDTLAQVLVWRNQIAFDTGDLQRAISGYEQQLKLLAVIDANDPPRRRKIALALALQGEVLALANQPLRARLAISRSHTIFEQLVALDSDNQDWLRNYARSHWYMARLLESEGATEQASDHYQSATHLLVGLVERDTTQSRWQENLAQAFASQLRFCREQNAETPQIPIQIEAVELRELQALRLACELEFIGHNTANCQESVALAEMAVNARPITEAYLMLYSLLRSQNDPRQEDVWSQLLERGVRNRAFVNTL